MTGTMSPLLDLQPMLHVEKMAPSVEFFEALGGRLVVGSRDGDWALITFGDTQLGLLAHPPNPEQGDEKLELQFIAKQRLESVAAQAQAAGLTLARGIADEFFGRQLQLRTPDGLLVKVNEIERELVT